jgi:hypothetical protein
MTNPSRLYQLYQLYHLSGKRAYACAYTRNPETAVQLVQPVQPVPIGGSYANR